MICRRFTQIFRSKAHWQQLFKRHDFHLLSVCCKHDDHKILSIFDSIDILFRFRRRGRKLAEHLATNATWAANLVFVSDDGYCSELGDSFRDGLNERATFCANPGRITGILDIAPQYVFRGLVVGCR